MCQWGRWYGEADRVGRRQTGRPAEWGRRRPDTRERKRNRIHAVPPPPRLSWEEGKWGTKDAHGPQLRSLNIQGHREIPPPHSRDQPRKTPPQPRTRRGWERGRVTTRVHEPLTRTRSQSLHGVRWGGDPIVVTRWP